MAIMAISVLHGNLELYSDSVEKMAICISERGKRNSTSHFVYIYLYGMYSCDYKSIDVYQDKILRIYCLKLLT